MGRLVLGRAARSSFALTIALIAGAGPLAAGCSKATCADYHDPTCWTPPPDAGNIDAEAIDAGLGDSPAESADEVGPDAAPGDAPAEATPVDAAAD